MSKNSNYAEPPPDRRRLKIFAFDPMLGRKAQNRITLDVANEELAKGPQGSRIAVIDYDGANKCYYTPVNLNDPALLMQDGLDPTEADPRFHQQMVYAVTMKVIENFEWALGLDPQRSINIVGFHSAFRVAPRGQLLVELVAQFTQKDDTQKDAFGGVPLRGGTTLIASADGQVRYVIAKPLPHASISSAFQREADARLARQKQFVTDCDTLDAKLAWADEKYDKARIKNAMNFASIHSGIVK